MGIATCFVAEHQTQISEDFVEQFSFWMLLPSIASRDARLGTSFNHMSSELCRHQRVQHSGDDYMRKFNWRSVDDSYYDHIEQAEMTGIAWECLRRNASFQRDHRTTDSSGRGVGEGFRQHWGLVFRS